MAWWELQDESFSAFLRGLFGEPDPRHRPPGKGGFDEAGESFTPLTKPVPSPTATRKPLGPEVPAPGLDNPGGGDFTKPPTASPIASPTASASGARPAPSASPTSPGEAVNLTGAALTKAALEAARAEFAAQSAPKPGELSEASPIYLGAGRSKANRADRDPASGIRGPVESAAAGDDVSTVGEQLQDIYTWDIAKRKRFSDLLIQSGVSNKQTIVHSELVNAWADLVKSSAMLYSKGTKMSPWDLLKTYATGEDSKSGRSSKTVTATNTRYTVTNALTARQLAAAALSERLGRQATDVEVKEFTKALLAAEHKDPTVTTQTTTTNAAGTSQTSTDTVREGVDPSAFAKQWSLEHNEEEAGAYQTAGLMMPWFFEGIGAAV